MGVNTPYLVTDYSYNQQTQIVYVFFALRIFEFEYCLVSLTW